AVIARDGRLAAWVVPRDPQPAQDLPAELRRFLAERLPEPLIPAAFAAVEAFPRTATGKIDRRALVASGPAPERLSSSREPEPPRTPLEEVLAGLFADVLELPPGAAVGIHDSFFELGGHSLLATALLAEVREVLELDLPLRTLFTAPTVAGLAAAIEADPAWRETAGRAVALLVELMEEGG
ncbi:MAG TPA: phosphopantetheine-binding protein, partial [Thermoanaerobaculia bacterium]|nr:phosphopantetheine-binding protein [Thermoanaerobaculia bacterium]